MCVSTIQKLFSKSVKWGVTSKSYQAADMFEFDVLNEKLLFIVFLLCAIGLTIACIICCRVKVILDMILGREDILSSWFVIILALRCFVIRML